MSTLIDADEEVVVTDAYGNKANVSYEDALDIAQWYELDKHDKLHPMTIATIVAALITCVFSLSVAILL